MHFQYGGEPAGDGGERVLPDEGSDAGRGVEREATVV